MRGDKELAVAITFCVALAVVLLSLFNSNNASTSVILVGGYSTFIFLAVIVKLICAEEVAPRVVTLLQFLSLFFFAAGCDLFMALQNDGYIKNLVTFYYKSAEPYLETPFFTVACYYDAVMHTACYVAIIYLVSRGKDYRIPAYFVGASMANSVMVLFIGSCLGNFGVKAPILLNLPYLLIPIFLIHELRSSGEYKDDGAELSCNNKLFFGLYFLGAGAIAIIRGLAALGSTVEVFSWYREDIEPYLGHATAYPKAQMLLYMFFFLPYYGSVLLQMVEGRTPSFSSAIIHAGAAAQAQVNYLGVFLKTSFDSEGQLPAGTTETYIFWGVNIALLIIPLLFACRCSQVDLYSCNPTVHTVKSRVVRKVHF